MCAYPYKALFPVGTAVRIADVVTLQEYMRPQWKFYHPVSNEMLAFAGHHGKVESVGYYHGGDKLYVNNELPEMTWHEACLSAV